VDVSSLGKLHILAFGTYTNTDRNCLDGDGCSGLHLSASRGHREVVKLFIEFGLDVNTKGNCMPVRHLSLTISINLAFNGTALHFASQNGHLEVIDLLVEVGIDLNSKSMP
jgi:ankyrin repeat protein